MATIEREAGRSRHTVQIMAHRVDAGAVAMAGLLQDVQGPEVVGADGVARRPVADNGHAANVLQQLAGLARIKLRRVVDVADHLRNQTSQDPRRRS